MTLLEVSPFMFTRGPSTAKVLFVGDYWDVSDAKTRQPFSGSAGKELHRMLTEAGLNPSEILFANVVNAYPPRGEFAEYVEENRSKRENGFRSLHGLRARDPLVSGLSKLETLITQLKPTLIIGAGNVPLWALTDHASLSTTEGKKLPGGINKWRGSQTYTRPIAGERYPFLPVVHPATILRSWDLRAATVHDLKSRAKRFLSGEIRWSPPARTALPNPTYDQTVASLFGWLTIPRDFYLSVDIETYRRKYITCIGLADENSEICIPFFYFDQGGAVVNYFTAEQEQTIWKLLRRLLSNPRCKIIGQNFIYDTQYFWRYYGIRAIVSFDTMVAHHLLFPGTPKGLSYLASLYSDYYCYWKDESEEWTDGLSHIDLWTYNCKDTRYTYDIAMSLRSILAAAKMEDLYAERLEQWKLARGMMLRGTLFNVSEKDRIRRELLDIGNDIQQWLMNIMPADLQFSSSGKPWFNSPTATMDIFYRVLGITPATNRKTGRPSSDAASLEVIGKRAPWVKPILRRLETLRSIGVFTSHFLEAGISPDHRIRTSFNIAGTDTYRWSSSANGFGEGTNLQNIPKGDEE